MMSEFLFPDTEDGLVTEVTFHAALKRAVDASMTLLIRDGVRTIALTAPIYHKKNSATLHIKGENTSVDGMCKICCVAHSVFHVGGRGAKLVLENVLVNHVCRRDDPKDIGACIFGLYKSDITLSNCSLASERGFCAWGVQKATFRLTSCQLTAKTRSSCVLFGKATLMMRDSGVRGAVHGICSRGETIIDVESTIFSGCGQRAVYAYQGCALRMEDCKVQTCESADHAAVDIKACGSGGTVSDAPKASVTLPVAADEDDDNNSYAVSRLANGSEETILGDDGKKVRIVSAILEPLTTASLYVDGANWAPVRGQLIVHIKNCYFENNSGIGLRIRQEAGAIVSGNVLQCHFCNNARGEFEHEMGLPQSAPDAGYGWMYEHDVGPNDGGTTWRPYAATDQALLDAAHRAWLADPTSAALSSVVLGDGAYRVELAAMEQTNVTTHYTRRVAFRISTHT